MSVSSLATTTAAANDSRGPVIAWLRPVCERLLTAIEQVHGDRQREPLATRAALRHAVTTYVRALRDEGISPPWVLESVIAFARSVRPKRGTPAPDTVEADVVRWSLAELEWPPPSTPSGNPQPSAASPR